MASGDTKTQQYLDIAANGTRADLPSDNCCNTRTQSLIVGVAERIMDVEDEVEELKNNPDVADIVATYEDLENYDTSKLTDKDIIRVLQDENHDGDSTYYRWSTTTETFTYIGESKQYVDFVGTDGISDGSNGLVPAPTTTDAGKYLNADGSWETLPKMVVLSYGISTWSDFLNAYNDNRVVYCRASSNANPATGTQTRMAFMAYVNNPTSPTNVEFQYYRSIATHDNTQQGDQVFVYKLTNANSWSVEVRETYTKIAAGANAEGTYSSGVLTVNPRLYTTTGQNTDGGITQKLFSDTVGNIESALNAINNGGNA